MKNIKENIPVVFDENTLMMNKLMQPKPKRIRNRNSERSSKTRYDKVKFSAETITVIKKALQQYKTDELAKERYQALELLCKTDDFFIIMYSEKVSSKKEKTNFVLQQQQAAEECQRKLFYSVNAPNEGNIEKEKL
jgi:hypothetical protein